MSHCGSKQSMLATCCILYSLLILHFWYPTPHSCMRFNFLYEVLFCRAGMTTMEGESCFEVILSVLIRMHELLAYMTVLDLWRPAL